MPIWHGMRHDPPLIPSQPKAGRVPARLGVSLHLWHGRFAAKLDPALVSRWLQEVERTGFTGVEFDPLLLPEPGLLRPVLDDSGLALAAASFAGGLLELNLDEERRRVAGVLDALLAAGCDLLVYTDQTRSVQDREEVPLAQRPQLRRDDLRRYGEKITRLADWLAGEGARLGYRPQLGTIIAGEAEVDLLMTSSDVTVGLTLDTGHLAAAGADPAHVLQRHAARLMHVHVLDGRTELVERARAEDGSFRHLIREGALTHPGDAAEAGTDLPDLVGRLADAGYNGWLVAGHEGEGAPADPPRRAELAFAALKDAVTATETDGSSARRRTA